MLYKWILIFLMLPAVALGQYAKPSGVWTERSDTLFAVDADGDTVAVMWDDDAGNVRWQVATEDQTLRMLIDSLFSPLLFGGTATTSDLTLQTTTGIGATGAAGADGLFVRESPFNKISIVCSISRNNILFS